MTSYLAAGGAHATVNHETDGRRFTVTCEAHGFIDAAYYSLDWDIPAVQRWAERSANSHAAKCRQIPDRLRTEAGAS